MKEWANNKNAQNLTILSSNCSFLKYSGVTSRSIIPYMRFKYMKKFQFFLIIFKMTPSFFFFFYSFTMKILLAGFGWIFLRSKAGCVFYSCDGWITTAKTSLKSKCYIWLAVTECEYLWRQSKERPRYPIIRKQREYTGSVTIF